MNDSDARKKLARKPLPRRGTKESKRVLPHNDGYTAQQERLSQSMAVFEDSLSGARVLRRDYATAVWLSSENMARVVRGTGSAVNCGIGVTGAHGAHMLYAEEALWLCEKGALCVYESEAEAREDNEPRRRVQLAALLDRVAAVHGGCAQFLVFAHLKRAGYAPLRHDRRRWPASVGEPGFGVGNSPSASTSSAAACVRSVLSVRVDAPDAPRPNVSRDWWPDFSALPADAKWPREGIVNVAAERHVSDDDDDDDYDDDDDDDDDALISRHELCSLPMAELLAKLRVLKDRAPLAKLEAVPPIRFDLYCRSAKRLKRTAPGPPDMCVAVLDYDEPFPSVAQLAAMQLSIGSIPLLLCVHQWGTISMYTCDELFCEPL
jgi:tRNA-splicing endonuclease subunit sen54 N-term